MQADPFKENLESRKLKEITPNTHLKDTLKHTKSFPTLLGKEKKKKNHTHTQDENKQHRFRKVYSSDLLSKRLARLSISFLGFTKEISAEESLFLQIAKKINK